MGLSGFYCLGFRACGYGFFRIFLLVAQLKRPYGFRGLGYRMVQDHMPGYSGEYRFDAIVVEYVQLQMQHTVSMIRIHTKRLRLSMIHPYNIP